MLVPTFSNTRTLAAINLKPLILNITFLFMTVSTLGQTKNFYSLTNDILLRIYSYETDSVTKKFLKKYYKVKKSSQKSDSSSEV